MNKLEEEFKVKNALIFDLHNLIIRCIFVAEKEDPFNTNYTYWKYLVLTNIFEEISKYQPDICVLACDDRKYWRKDIYPEYKAHRRADREKSVVDFDAFYKMFNGFYEELKNLFTNMYILKVDKCEADDIIAILSERIKDHIVINISTDSDLHQLYKHKNYRQYNPIRKCFVENINPSKFLLCKIITGDKQSDNIPGIKFKVGIKTAEKILQSGLQEYLDKENLQKEFDRNKQLIDLECIPIEYKLSIQKQFDTYELKPVSSKTLYNFFIKHKQKYCLENINSIINTLKLLKC